MITYRLYEKGNGMIQDRCDATVDQNGLVLKFTGCPDADVTFQKDNETITRKLANGKCRLEKAFLVGEVRVIAAKDDKIWSCESLYCYPIGDRVLVRPDVIDTSRTIVELSNVVDELQKVTEAMRKKLNEIIKDSKSGYDIL